MACGCLTIKKRMACRQRQVQAIATNATENYTYLPVGSILVPIILVNGNNKTIYARETS